MPSNNKLKAAYQLNKESSFAPYMEVSSSVYNNRSTVSEPRTAKTKLYMVNNTSEKASGTQSAVNRAYNQPMAPSISTTNTQSGGTLRKAMSSQAAPLQKSIYSVQNNSAYQPTALQAAYGSSESSSGAYSAQRQNAINQATANYNKLLNYMPEYMELMGMRGLGVSEQAYINAANDYQQNIADINARYDEMEKSAQEQQITMTNSAYGELSRYITEAGDNFTTEGYERFKQGLIQSGYTPEQIAAAENLLGDNDYNQATKKNDPIYNGMKSLSITIYDAAGRKNNSNIYLTDALDTTYKKDLQRLADNAAKKLGLNVKDGTAIREGNLIVVYYKGQWYMFNSKTLGLKEQK